MNKKFTLRNSFLGLSLISAMAVSAETITIEAESPIESDQVATATLDAEGSEASGLAGLSMDNANRGSYAVYAFNAPEAGTYDLKVWYITMNTRWISVQLNEQVANLMKCDVLSGGWNGVGSDVIIDEQTGESEYRAGVVSKSIPVYCEKGQNFLMVKAIYGYSPEEGRDLKFAPTIDRFELTPATEQITKPRDWSQEIDRITRQCEDYDAVTGNVTTDDRPPFTNKRGTSISQNGGTVSYNVNAPEEGVYLMELWYATMQRRWISVKVNKQVTSYVSFSDFSQGWGNDDGEWYCQRQIPLYLKKGANTITFGQHTQDGGKEPSEHGDSPSMDYFTIDLVSFPEMTEPENEIAMYRSALSDIAQWSGDFDSKLVSDHNEFTVATSSSNNANLILEFPVAIYMSAYAYATDDNSENWTVETSVDGKSWTVADVTSKNANGNISTCIASSGDAPVKFVRLNATGDKAASLGDFAVFGNMSETLNNAMLPAGFSDYETTHMGFDVNEWHEGIDKLFDGDPFTQFTVAQDGDGGMGDNDEIRITIYLPSEAIVKAYSMATHRTSYLDRAPKTWTLEAFDYEANEGEGSYVTVDSRKDMNFVTAPSTLAMNVAEPIKSDCYVLTLKNRRNRATHLSDLQFYSEGFDGIAGVENLVVENAIAVYGGNGYLTIMADKGARYAIYTISGAVAANGECFDGATQVRLAAGLYIAQVDGRAVKVIVK